MKEHLVILSPILALLADKIKIEVVSKVIIRTVKSKSGRGVGRFASGGRSDPGVTFPPSPALFRRHPSAMFSAL